MLGKSLKVKMRSVISICSLFELVRWWDESSSWVPSRQKLQLFFYLWDFGWCHSATMLFKRQKKFYLQRVQPIGHKLKNYILADFLTKMYLTWISVLGMCLCNDWKLGQNSLIYPQVLTRCQAWGGRGWVKLGVFFYCRLDHLKIPLPNWNFSWTSDTITSKYLPLPIKL